MLGQKIEIVVRQAMVRDMSSKQSVEMRGAATMDMVGGESKN